MFAVPESRMSNLAKGILPQYEQYQCIPLAAWTVRPGKVPHRVVALGMDKDSLRK